MKHLFNFFSIFLLLFFGCKRDTTSCGETKTISNYISAASLNQTPYFTNQAFDTISFASDKGDTLIFVKTKIDSSWYIETEQGSPDCPNPFANYYQNLKITYLSFEGNGILEIKHSKKCITSISKSILNHRVEIRFGELYFDVTDDKIGTNNGITLIDSITFNSIEYYYKANPLYHMRNKSEIGKCYINVDFGVFRIEDVSNNENWILL